MHRMLSSVKPQHIFRDWKNTMYVT
jgi:hypothetical protein